VRLEHLPLILGALLGIVGVALVVDAWTVETALVTRERRRRVRAERSRLGEGLLGLGTIAMAAAFIGRDDWRYGTVAVILGVLLLAAGAVMNWRFLYETVAFRGPERRDPSAPAKPEISEEDPSERIGLH
jgi:drug/metabolite transporter (DMT)-like permease